MIAANIQKIKQECGEKVKVIAVSKTKPVSLIMEAYEAGQRAFGENKVQEMTEKRELMPADIEWHMIGHLQSNKVKYIASFVHLVHSVDGLKLLETINREGMKHNRVIDCLLQVFIADEETKFGLDEAELTNILRMMQEDPARFSHVRIRGLMGMATNTEDEEKVRGEFRTLKHIFDRVRPYFDPSEEPVLSMGMSSDYSIAVQEGSTMVRVGSSIFGDRQ